jgi:hypothetical protein
MHAHKRGIELKEEEEEELQEREKLSRRGKKNLQYINESSRNERRSLTRLLIALLKNSQEEGRRTCDT